LVVLRGETPKNLTPRQHQIMKLVTRGLTNRQIAIELGIKENTVKNWLVKIYDKMGVVNRVQAAVIYIKSYAQMQAEELASG
jgi:DNA-binding NarL/FixJ family response regulator